MTIQEIYTEMTVYPKIEQHIKETELMIKDPNHKNLLDFWYDCNAFKLQLGEIYKRYQKRGNLTESKEFELTKKANELSKLERIINKL